MENIKVKRKTKKNKKKDKINKFGKYSSKNIRFNVNSKLKKK